MIRRLFVLGLLLAGAPAFAQEPYRPELTPAQIADYLGDDHYGVYAEGTKCGWARMRLERRERPTPRYVATFQMTFRLTAMGDRFEMEARESVEFAAEAPYAWLGESSTERENEQVSARAMRATPDGISVTVFSGTEQTKMSFPAVDYTLADYLASAHWVRAAPRAVGEGVRYRDLDSDEVRVTTEQMTVTGERQVLVDGVKGKVFDFLLHSEEEGEMGTAVIDERGRMLSAVMMGLFEIRLEPEELAKQIEFSADLFVSGMAKIDQPLGDPSLVTRLVVQAEGPVAERLRAGPWQSVVREGEGVVLTIDVGRGPSLEAEPGDAERYLRETTGIPVNHPEIKALAEQAVGEAATPAEKVAKLVHFVSEYVEDAYGRDQIDVLSVVRNKVGDCTEHAALLTALARAAGIPAREASGLIYMDDALKAFGGHAWNEVLLDGKWVPVDATWDEVTINATHIKLSHDGGEMERYGKLKLSLLEVERREE